MENFGIDRAVIVQPSVYGFDNRLLVDVLKRDPNRFRGIAVINPDLPDAQLGELHASGIRGVRFNLLHPAGLPLTALKPLARRIASYGWHIQILARVGDMTELEEVVMKSGVPIVFDHFGLVDPRGGENGAGFQRLLRLADAEACYVKLSAPYRVTNNPSQLQPFIEVLTREVPEKLVWGTDWPHPEFYDVVPDDAALVDIIGSWLPTPALRQTVLVDNPLRLYWA